jgi:hypothetical protein
MEEHFTVKGLFEAKSLPVPFTFTFEVQAYFVGLGLNLQMLEAFKRDCNITLIILLSQQNATSLHCFSFVNADASPKKGSSTTPPSKSAIHKGILSIHKLVLSGNQAMVSMEMVFSFPLLEKKTFKISNQRKF